MNTGRLKVCVGVAPGMKQGKLEIKECGLGRLHKFYFLYILSVLNLGSLSLSAV